MFNENYHTHMRLCHHAEGSIEDYVLEAIKLGFTDLGISDHGPLDNAGFERMTLDEFYYTYLKEFHLCKEKYGDKINLYVGLEIEYMYGKKEYLEDLLSYIDYLILGNHYYSGNVQNKDTSSYACNTKERLEEYVKLTEDALDTGLFKIMAHPDIFLAGYPTFDENVVSAIRRICQACIKNNVYLECNVSGYDKGIKNFGEFVDYSYPNYHFFKIASEYKDLKIIVSSDAHKPLDLNKNFEKGYEMLKELNIVPISHPLEK